MLSMIRPKCKETYGIYNPTGVKVNNSSTIKFKSS